MMTSVLMFAVLSVTSGLQLGSRAMPARAAAVTTAGATFAPLPALAAYGQSLPVGVEYGDVIVDHSLYLGAAALAVSVGKLILSAPTSLISHRIV